MVHYGWSPKPADAIAAFCASSTWRTHPAWPSLLCRHSQLVDVEPPPHLDVVAPVLDGAQNPALSPCAPLAAQAFYEKLLAQFVARFGAAPSLTPQQK